MAAGRAPDFYIVGHPKCGTTALWQMLREHPQIFMPENKEPRFFASDLGPRTPPRGEIGRRLMTLEGYLELFAPALPGQRVGEASPNYLRSRVAASRIAELRPDARIIAILREPASFLRSLHQQMISSNGETQRDLRKAMALEPARSEGRRIPRNCRRPDSLLYSRHIRYVEQLRRYHEAFGREQVMTIVYDDFRADNDAVVRAVLRFLDVEATVPVAQVDTNKVPGVRSLPLHHLAGAVRVARNNPGGASRLARGVNALTPGVLRSDPVRRTFRRFVYGAPPTPDPDFMAELRERFKPEVQALSEYLGRDLVTLWGYGQSGPAAAAEQHAPAGRDAGVELGEPAA